MQKVTPLGGLFSGPMTAKRWPAGMKNSRVSPSTGGLLRTGRPEGEWNINAG